MPRKAGLLLHALSQQYDLTLTAETLGVGSAKLPEVEDAESPRALFEERITLLRDFTKMLDALYDAFLKVRASSSWEGHTGVIRHWISQTNKPIAQVA